MDLIRFDELKKTWLEIAGDQNGSVPTSFEIQVYKKLLELFHVGNYYYYIFNAGNASIEFVSDGVSGILGIPKENFTVEWVLENIHPKDFPRFIAHEQKVTEFFNNLSTEQVLKYKVSYDYRLKCDDNSYKWILQQVTTIQSDEKGAVIRTLGIHTDISHLKTSDLPSGLSFIGMDGEPSYLNVSLLKNSIEKTEDFFSDREKEVLQLMLKGNTSIEIAKELFISKHTVDSHRKNILSKSGCKSLAELGAKAIQNGWV